MVFTIRHGSYLLLVRKSLVHRHRHHHHLYSCTIMVDLDYDVENLKPLNGPLHFFFIAFPNDLLKWKLKIWFGDVVIYGFIAFFFGVREPQGSVFVPPRKMSTLRHFPLERSFTKRGMCLIFMEEADAKLICQGQCRYSFLVFRSPPSPRCNWCQDLKDLLFARFQQRVSWTSTPFVM